MVQDDLRSRLVLVVKEHFRLRRELLGQLIAAEEVKQLTNGFLYGVQHTLEAVGGHSDEAQLAAHLRLHINRDKVDEANAMVDAL